MRLGQQTQQRMRQLWIQSQQQQRQKLARDYWDQQRQRAGYARSLQSRHSQSGCFIATAACGSDQAVAVVQLRQFRDVVLQRTLLGRAFIGVYERVSPPLAHGIAHSAFARDMVRYLMVQPAGWIAAWLCQVLNKT